MSISGQVVPNTLAEAQLVAIGGYYTVVVTKGAEGLVLNVWEKRIQERNRPEKHLPPRHCVCESFEGEMTRSRLNVYLSHAQLDLHFNEGELEAFLQSVNAFFTKE